MSDSPSLEPVEIPEIDIGHALEMAMSEPNPRTLEENLTAWCERMRKELIEYEVQWSDPDWTFLRQMEAHKTALDKLREAVKGCGKRLDVMSRCGDRETEWLCYGCQLKRDAAIAALLGEGASHGG